MKKYVGLQRSHEEEGGGAGILNAHHTGISGPPKIVSDDAEAAPRWCVVAAGVERDDEGGLRSAVHVDGEIRAERGLDEGDKSLREVAQHRPGIGGGIDQAKVRDEFRQLHWGALHGHGEQLLFGAAVAEHRGRRHAETAGNLRKCGGLKTSLNKDGAGSLEDLDPGDAGRTSHG